MKEGKQFRNILILIALNLFCVITLLGIIVFSLSDVYTLPTDIRLVLMVLSTAMALGNILVSVQALCKYLQFCKLCQRFIKGEIYQEFIEKSSDISEDLGGAVKRLDNLLDRQEIIKMSTQQAEYLALQNQINPHFLYNTLDAIRGDALCIGAENIADTTEALSTFFRYTITETGSLVTLREELDNVDNYFRIQRYRFGEKMSLEVLFHDDKETLLQMKCPKLSLQPIVENAIFHGIERTTAGGKITIDIEMEEKRLHIDISDNGVGMEEGKVFLLNEQLGRASVGYIMEEPKKKKGGIALKNVSRRIKLLFGEEYGLHINSIPGIGTKVEMTLPLVQTSEKK